MATRSKVSTKAKAAASHGIKTALYAGSFDPITLGHLDVIRRALQIFDRVIVAIGKSQAKPPLFDLDERVAMVQETCRAWPQVEVKSFSGLAVNFAQNEQATCLVRGLRTDVDFTYEMQMALMNRTLAPSLETVFVPTSQEFGHVSSTLVKEVASYGGDVSTIVTPLVFEKLTEKFLQNGRHPPRGRAHKDGAKLK